MTAASFDWVATCARGLEPILAAELDSIGSTPTSRSVGGVGFVGDLATGMRANWRLRTANRILLRLASWAAPDAEALYRGAYDLDLGPLLPAERSFAIVATSSRSLVRDTRWIALRVKDGLVDAQRERLGVRSSVDREAPDVALRVRLHDDVATLLLDSSGEPLDRRGYRVAATKAPLREQLAAGVVLASGWGGRGPVVDPMCGSGTLLAEAGAIALGLPPNRLRSAWAFERFPDFERESFEEIRRQPLPAPDPNVRLFGVDLDREAHDAARRNLATAGLTAHAELTVADAFDWEPPEAPGLVVVNPPYGSRIDDSPDQWRRLGDLLKRRYRGFRAAVLAGDARLGKSIGLKPTQRIPVWNGPLEARILVFELW